MLAESVAGELIKSEIEIRSGRGETFADADRAPARGARAPVPAGRRARRAAGRHRHPSVEPVAGAADHRHRALPARGRGAPVRRVAQQHVLAARARGRPRRRARGERCATACARCCRSCWRCRPTRRSSTAATRGCTPRARRSSPRASRAAASPTRSAAGPAYADYVDFLIATRLDRRADPDLVERAAAPLVRHRRAAHLRRADERAPTRPRSQALIDRLRSPRRRSTRTRACRSTTRPPRLDRGELLARDPLRARRQADRPRPRARSSRRRRCRSGCSTGPRRRARSSASTPALPERERRPAPARALEQGATMEEVYAAEVAETQRTYAAEEVRRDRASHEDAASCPTWRDVLVQHGGDAGQPGRHPADRRRSRRTRPRPRRRSTRPAALLPLCPEDAVAADQGRRSRRCRCCT